MVFNNLLVLSALILFSCNQETAWKNDQEKSLVKELRAETIVLADSFMNDGIITVTDSYCERSAGGIHDFYSEADYFWPDPDNPDDPYIHRDGQSNPDNFSSHRHAMVRLSEHVTTLTSAWLLTGEEKYAVKAIDHLHQWFVDTATTMNPNMLYSQATPGLRTGWGIGLIDAYHFVEVTRSTEQLIKTGALHGQEAEKIKNWFAQFLNWMTTHKYGIDEMNMRNNHATCWLATASSMAKLTSNDKMLEMCRERFKNVLLPNQMAEDGSFPNELRRTKPYGYSLFNMDAFANVAQILSTTDDNLWEFSTPDGKNLQKGMDYIFPFIKDKSKWPYEKDIYIWDEWPARQSCLLFAGLNFQKPEYIDVYLNLCRSTHPEVFRNLPVRHPIIWFNRIK